MWSFPAGIIVFIFILPIQLACSPVEPNNSILLSGDGFFDTPWPSDSRTTEGGPDLSNFPGVTDYPILEGYIAEAQNLDGFGTNSPLFMRFQNPMDTTLLPTPDQSAHPDSPLFLLNIDPISDARGTLTPIEWHFQTEATRWQPENLLAVQPVWGMPLRPRTRYALVVTTDIAKKESPFADLWHRSQPEYAAWQDLADTLRLAHIDQDRVAYASQFTTQDTSGEMARLVYRVQEGMRSDPLDQELEFIRSNAWYSAWRGHTRVPIFQHGEPPFLTEGGGFVFDEQAWPVLAGWESVEMVVTIPAGSEAPEDGWPVVLYVHGTGGNAEGFANENIGTEVASMLATAGAVGVGIALPFHGDRYMGVDPALVSFNYFNATAGRSNFRQATLEQIWLIESLTDQAHHWWGESEDLTIDVHTNPDSVAYMGHSHGGELGSIAAPFIGHKVQGVVLSGAGGGISISAVHRTADDYPIQDLLRETFQFEDHEELNEFHPLLGMIQLVGEATDPINYSPYWNAVSPNWNSEPVDILLFEGLFDVYTPPKATEAMAGAARIPILAPVAQQSLVQELLQIDGVEAPTTANVEGWNGTMVTGGLVQYSDNGHFTVFNDFQAARQYRDFLSSALYDEPTITTGED